MKYTNEQLGVINGLIDFVESSDDNYAVLEAPAGCGKTTCIKAVVDAVGGSRCFGTAPTNKAVKVLKAAISGAADTLTIHKLLGLRLLPTGEIKYLSGFASVPYMPEVRLIVVDEGSQIGRDVANYIDQTAEANKHIKWIFLGDRWQLPPVKESLSPIWALPNKFKLTKVMRNDSQVLRLATHVREVLEFGKKLDIKEDNDGVSGVFKPQQGLMRSVLDHAECLRNGTSKAMAWRNSTVDKMNAAIRKELLKNPDESLWQIGERVTVTEPVKDLYSPTMLANTDEEGEIIEVEIVNHPLHRKFTAYRLVMMTDDSERIVLYTPHESSFDAVKNYRQELANLAKSDRKLWKDFWMFHESWAAVRHGYVATTHKSQGSTYEQAFVDWKDIMLNKKREEALRCLYVAVSRPKFNLYLG